MTTITTEPPTPVALLLPRVASSSPIRRSYRCYDCNYSFSITRRTSNSAITSLRCPRCHHRPLFPIKISRPNSTSSAQSCAICLDDIVLGSGEVEELPCKHYFHRDCVGKWLERRRTCPLCRRRLSSSRSREERIDRGGRLHPNLAVSVSNRRGSSALVHDRRREIDALRDADGDTLMIDV